MDEQRFIAKGKRPVSKEEWDATWQNAPRVVLSEEPNVLEQIWQNAPRLERSSDDVVFIPANSDIPSTGTV